MRKRGQAAVEMIIILAVVLVILLAIIKFNNKSLSYSLRLENEAKAKAFLGDVENAVKNVYRQGIGSRIKIYVSVPDNLQSINISGKTIKVIFNKGTTFVKKFDFNVSGNISIREGNYNLIIESNENNVTIKNE